MIISIISMKSGEVIQQQKYFKCMCTDISGYNINKFTVDENEAVVTGI